MTSATTSNRQCVCYPCALRMSTIPLAAVCGQRAASSFPRVVLTAPPGPSEVERQSTDFAVKSPEGYALPFSIVTSHHPLFDIIYEHNSSYIRRVEEERREHSRRKVPIVSVGSDGRHADMKSTQQIDLPSELESAIGVMTMASSEGTDGNTHTNANTSRRHHRHPICCACRGLYQFLDGYYIPRAVEEVRRSPFLSANEISVNVSVPRGFAFVWLAAAAEYLRGAIAVLLTFEKMQKKAEESDEATKESGTCSAAVQRLPAFPEDYSSFKDMFTPDLRARMMARLGKAEEEGAAAQKAAEKRDREEEEGDEESGKGTKQYRPRCGQAFGYSHTGTSGVIVDFLAQNDLAEELTGEGLGDGTAVNAAGYTIHLSRGQMHEGRRNRTNAVLPKEWCTNKGAASGEPLQLFIIDDFVLPYMRQTDEGFFKGHTVTTPKDLGIVPIGETAESLASHVISFHIQEAVASLLASNNDTDGDVIHNKKWWTCFVERSQWTEGGKGMIDLADANAYIISDHDHPQSSLAGPTSSNKSSSTFVSRAIAPLQCTVRHASVFIIGRYHKYMRGMSQSPWFGEGLRIGSFPLSLQEYIANPILPLFFPYGIPQPVPPPGTPAAKAAAAAALYLKQQQQQQKAQEGGSNSSSTTPATCAAFAEAAFAAVKATEGEAAEEGAADGSHPQHGVTQKTSLGNAVQSVDPNLIALFHVLGYGNYKFHTAGREDVDVRMLGTGRPFVLEIISPHCDKIDFEAAKKAVADFYNGAELITIDDLGYTTSEITVIMSKHSSEKTKMYRAVVYSSRPILSDDDPLLVAANRTKDLVVEQSTPVRVLHRRSLLSRPKTIHSLNLRRINNNWLVADLETQAGTYIKEFVHGDMGRTVPSLGTLLDSRMDIIQLDVLGMSSMDSVTSGGSDNAH